MVYIIVKRSARELRERMAEAPREYHGKVRGYARDVEEAARVSREEFGSDNPNAGLILCDDGGKAELELRTRAGLEPFDGR